MAWYDDELDRLWSETKALGLQDCLQALIDEGAMEAKRNGKSGQRFWEYLADYAIGRIEVEISKAKAGNTVGAQEYEEAMAAYDLLGL